MEDWQYPVSFLPLTHALRSQASEDDLQHESKIDKYVFYCV